MKKVLFIVFIALFLFIINNFFHSIYRLWQKQDLIVTARKELEREKREQQRLKQELKTVQDPTYLEEEARNKLFLVKPGEQTVVVPSTPSPEVSRPKVVKNPQPVWLQWYTLVR